MGGYRAEWKEVGRNGRSLSAGSKRRFAPSPKQHTQLSVGRGDKGRHDMSRDLTTGKNQLSVAAQECLLSGTSVLDWDV